MNMGRKLTTSEFINQCKKIHNDFYDYSKTEYLSAHSKITITCLLHGDFIQNANDHKKGSGCYFCGIDKIKMMSYKTTHHFINKSKIIHGDKYDYSKVIYKDAITKVKILCKFHGYFMQTPEAHYKGNGCIKCGQERCNLTRIKNENVQNNCWSYTDWKNKAINSKKFDSYKCYLIKCWNYDEEFYKIGKTFRKINERFSNKKEMPYSWELIHLWKGDAIHISKLEKRIQKENKANKIIPKIKFGGSYECFKKINQMENKKLEKVIWEGWRIIDFIEELEPEFDMIMRGQSWQQPFKTKEEVKSWCMDNQPYYKKHIPEVVNYFSEKI